DAGLVGWGLGREEREPVAADERIGVRRTQEQARTPLRRDDRAVTADDEPSRRWVGWQSSATLFLHAALRHHGKHLRPAGRTIPNEIGRGPGWTPRSPLG